MVVVGRSLLALALLVGLLVLGIVPGSEPPPASAASVVANTTCRRYDPNLVRGACLRYQARTGTAYTWIGSYRASNGHVFFCIDYLYDSRISGAPKIVPSTTLVNQLGKRVGNAEVAALNYVISTWAAHGSTGSDSRDAAIALLIRELMSDGVRPDGTVVYPRGLKVGQSVKAPIGGLSGPIMTMARAMWSQASLYYGSYTVRMVPTATGPLKLGTTRAYAVSVLSASGRAVPGITVSFRCTGPVRCPAALTSRAVSTGVRLKPSTTGTYTLLGSASGPSSDGHVYRVHNWGYHGGSTAKDNGVQRGWIAERSATTAQVRDTVVIVKGTPTVVTRASDQTAAPGAALSDTVTVNQWPAGSHQQVTARLYGPFTARPSATSCTEDKIAGSVTLPVDGNGTFTTPTLTTTQPGYYVWTESFPGDALTNPVTTPCGVAEETTLVEAPKPEKPTPSLHHPGVHTRASVQHALVGASVHDTVIVSGLATGDRITVRWSLRGPLAPRRGSCDHLDWSGAEVLASGSFVVTRNGTYRTAATTLTRAGCVTYAELIAPTPTTTAAHSAPGLPAETVVVSRPATPFVPEIPSGPYVVGRPGRVDA